MKLGTENKKKVAALGVLSAVAGYLVYANLSGPSTSSSSPVAARQAADRPVDAGILAPEPASAPSAALRPGGRGAVSRGQKGDEFHPVLHSKRPEDRIDPMSVDPTLRLDLLARLQEVKPADGARNLFQFGKPPEPKVELPKGPEPKVLPKPPAPVNVAANNPSKQPEPPPAPLINLKYYGFSILRDNGKKTAFFLDGDDILMATEGETLKRRYRIVRIELNSVTMEDTESKRQQSVALTAEAQV